MITSFFEKFIYFILSAIMSMSAIFAVQPATDEPIEPLRPDECRASFAVIADTQFTTYTPNRYPYFKSTSEDLHNNNGMFDALILAGDITETGSAAEYQMVYDRLSGLDNKYIFATGNHDIREQSYESAVSKFTKFINTINEETVTDKLRYSVEINGYKFIVTGTDNYQFEKAYLSNEQLLWIENEIASSDGKPVFVIGHQPLKKTHGLPSTWRASVLPDDGNIGEQSDELKTIIEKYPNVFFITGHIHTGLGKYTYEKLGDSHLICLPSVSVANFGGEYNSNGTGFVAEVYDNEVIFRARNFSNGKWIPEHDIVISINPQTVNKENESFVQS